MLSMPGITMATELVENFRGLALARSLVIIMIIVMAQESIVGQNLLFDRNVLFFNIWLHNAHAPTDYVLDGLPTDPRK